jgi:hypothetical protein
MLASLEGLRSDAILLQIRECSALDARYVAAGLSYLVTSDLMVDVRVGHGAGNDFGPGLLRGRGTVAALLGAAPAGLRRRSGEYTGIVVSDFRQGSPFACL